MPPAALVSAGVAKERPPPASRPPSCVLVVCGSNQLPLVPAATNYTRFMFTSGEGLARLLGKRVCLGLRVAGAAEIKHGPCCPLSHLRLSAWSCSVSLITRNLINRLF